MGRPTANFECCYRAGEWFELDTDIIRLHSLVKTRFCRILTVDPENGLFTVSDGTDMACFYYPPKENLEYNAWVEPVVRIALYNRGTLASMGSEFAVVDPDAYELHVRTFPVLDEE